MSEIRPRLTEGMFTSRTEEWETPQYVFDELDKEFHFSLDVCATPQNVNARGFSPKKKTDSQ